MSEMVERVAKAIMARFNDPLPFHAEELARAAIEAMREPTNAMERAGDEYGRFTNGPSACVVWEAMIDEALKD